MQAFAPDSCFGGPGKGETRLFKRYLERACKVAGGLIAHGAVKMTYNAVINVCEKRKHWQLEFVLLALDITGL